MKAQQLQNRNSKIIIYFFPWSLGSVRSASNPFVYSIQRKYVRAHLCALWFTNSHLFCIYLFENKETKQNKRLWRCRMFWWCDNVEDNKIWKWIHSKVTYGWLPIRAPPKAYTHRLSAYMTQFERVASGEQIDTCWKTQPNKIKYLPLVIWYFFLLSSSSLNVMNVIYPSVDANRKNTVCACVSAHLIIVCWTMSYFHHLSWSASSFARWWLWRKSILIITTIIKRFEF